MAHCKQCDHGGPVNDKGLCLPCAVKTNAEAMPPAQPQSEPTRTLIEECRAALAEEFSAWDIDPPLHHVKQAHDRCVAWLAAQPPERAAQQEAQEAAPTVTECEACFTPDACQLRGTCDHYSAEKLRVAAATPLAVKPMQALTDEQIAEFAALCVMNRLSKKTARELLAEYREELARGITKE